MSMENGIDVSTGDSNVKKFYDNLGKQLINKNKAISLLYLEPDTEYFFQLELNLKTSEGYKNSNFLGICR